MVCGEELFGKIIAESNLGEIIPLNLWNLVGWVPGRILNMSFFELYMIRQYK